jgi:hypothetical protein
MTTTMAPKINTSSKATIMSSEHILMFRDVWQLVCDVSHTDVMT